MPAATAVTAFIARHYVKHCGEWLCILCKEAGRLTRDDGAGVYAMPTSRTHWKQHLIKDHGFEKRLREFESSEQVATKKQRTMKESISSMHDLTMTEMSARTWAQFSLPHWLFDEPDFIQFLEYVHASNGRFPSAYQVNKAQFDYAANCAIK
jgi:hypothetical protein